MSLQNELRCDRINRGLATVAEKQLIFFGHKVSDLPPSVHDEAEAWCNENLEFDEWISSKRSAFLPSHLGHKEAEERNATRVPQCVVVFETKEMAEKFKQAFSQHLK